MNPGEESTSKKRKSEASTSEASTSEERTTKFTVALTGVCNVNGTDVTGLLRKRMRGCDGSRENRPYDHQRKCAKRAIHPSQNKMIMCHDPGTGKTFTFLLIVAGMHTLSGGVKSKTMVSAPASCLQQWKNACLNTLRIPESRILMTNKANQVTAKSLKEHDFFIFSRDLIGRIFSSCYEYVQRHHQNDNGNWLSQWDHKPHVATHPLLTMEFDLVGIDEVHFMRNPLTRWTKGHEIISANAKKVVAMTATPIFNKPLDLVGISTAMNLGPGYKDEKTWFTDKKKTKVNFDTIRVFQRELFDRVKDTCLNLPPITDHYRDFDACIDPTHAEEYNMALLRARKLRMSLERKGKATQQDLQKLMAYLQTLQQFMVSPLLASKGAKEVQSDPELVQKCSFDNTGSLRALKSSILQLQSEGFSRVMVAVCHTSLMVVAEAYLFRECPGVGNVILYHGALTLKKRSEATTSFLGNPKTVMLMSVDAGGTGLHLVPGANAVIFWGSRPYSPMQVIQTKKRVHRIGQDFPVKVVHLIAKGSVDYAIDLIHKDKLTLAKAVMDSDMEALESEDGRWRKVGRIVNGCMFLDDKTGSFPSKPITELEVVSRLQGAIRSRAQPSAPVLQLHQAHPLPANVVTAAPVQQVHPVHPAAAMAFAPQAFVPPQGGVTQWVQVPWIPTNMNPLTQFGNTIANQLLAQAASLSNLVHNWN